jgi:transposase
MQTGVLDRAGVVLGPWRMNWFVASSSTTHFRHRATQSIQNASKSKAPQLEQIQHMIKSGSPRAEIAYAAGCSEQAVTYIRQNQAFGNVRAPRNGVGRRRSITPVMLEAILERLKEKPTLYLDELVVIIYDDFGKHVTKQSLSRTLTSIGWSNKAARQRAKERNANLRDH